MKISPPNSLVDLPTETSSGRGPSQRAIPPLAYAVIGFFVYYGLFVFVTITGRKLDYSAILTVTIMKLFIFGVTVWILAYVAETNRKTLVIAGATLAVFAAALLLWKADSSPQFVAIFGALEAIGDAALTSGLVGFIRVETTSNDRYIGTTMWWRGGQNLGMALAFWLSAMMSAYALVVFVIRVFVLLAIGLIFGRRSIHNRSSDSVGSPNDQQSQQHLTLDKLVGSGAYALFLLLVFGPGVFPKYDFRATGAMNGFFAFGSVALMALLLQAYPRVTQAAALLRFERSASIGVTAVILLWMHSLWAFISQKSAAAEQLVGLAGAVIALFTTAIYVLGELRSGTTGRRSNQFRQILSYLALVRLGPMIALLLILGAKWLLDHGRIGNTTALVFLELVVLAVLMVTLTGIASKWFRSLRRTHL